jgi:hypothetical protein
MLARPLLVRCAGARTRSFLCLEDVHKVKPDLVINAAECAEKQNRELSHADRMEMFRVNTLLPQTIARVCSMTNTPLGHVSSGSIYSGAKVFDRGAFRIEEDLGLPSTHSLFASHSEKFSGFTELDDPNFLFKGTTCSFYSGTKTLAEEALRNSGIISGACAFLSTIRMTRIIFFPGFRTAGNSMTQLTPSPIWTSVWAPVWNSGSGARRLASIMSSIPVPYPPAKLSE